MAILKPISGHGNLVDKHCRDYMLGIGQFENKYHGKRCSKITYINIAQDGKTKLNWDEQMDVDRINAGTNLQIGKNPVRTYNHYIFSPDPRDKVSVDELDEALKEWAERVFQNKFSLVIHYHNDNTNKVTHAHMYINNVNWDYDDKFKRIGDYVNISCWEYASQLWQYMCKERGWTNFLDKQKDDLENTLAENVGNYDIKHDGIDYTKLDHDHTEQTKHLYKIDEEYFKKYTYFNHDINYRRPYKKSVDIYNQKLKRIPFSTKNGKSYTLKAREAKERGEHLWTDDIRNIIEIAYYQSNNINDFSKTLNKYNVKIFTKNNDYLYTHPTNPDWKVNGKRLGKDYTKTRINQLFNKQITNKYKKSSPIASDYENISKKVNTIIQSYSYKSKNTNVKLIDIAKTMRINSFYNIWNLKDFDNKIKAFTEDKDINNLLFAKKIMSQIEDIPITDNVSRSDSEININDINDIDNFLYHLEAKYPKNMQRNKPKKSSKKKRKSSYKKSKSKNKSSTKTKHTKTR